MTTYFKMKVFLSALFAFFFLASCNKPNEFKNNNHARSYSSEVLDKWMTLQLRLMRNATGVPNHGFSRHYAYSGVAALEALRPGLLGNDKWSEKWNGLNGLPQAGKARDYYYPANVNAALASMNRAFFPNASVADKAAIDSLEVTLYAAFATTQSQQVLQTSSDFGKAVATAVFTWADTDGYKNASNPYTVPVGQAYGSQHLRLLALRLHRIGEITVRSLPEVRLTRNQHLRRLILHQTPHLFIRW
jgi:hypothetical protein